MLRVENVHKSFNGRKILDGVNITIRDGEIYGLVGANGAGKTTIMNIISKLINADQGQIFIDDKKIEKVRDLRGKLGFIMDIPSLYDYMTAYEYFKYLSSICENQTQSIEERSKELLDLVGLSDVGDKRIKSFSRGMQQRFGIAVGLFNNPSIVIMDEPTSALDPIGRYEISNIIKNLKANGKTVLLSTHILSDVEKICDRIGILVGGVIKKEGTIEHVLSEYSRPIYEIVPERDAETVFKTFENKEYIKKIKIDNNMVKLEIVDDEKIKNLLLRDLSELNIPINSFNVHKPSLEKIFLMEASKK